MTFLYNHDSALLADEMGLGKTVQTIVALELLLKEPGLNRAIIISPASLKLNWIRELNTWAPNLTVRQVNGPFREREALYILPIPVLVASYEQIRNDALSIKILLKFDIVILDEAQRIKNRASNTALACRLIEHKRSWALTGTPIENKQDDLISIFSFLKPNHIDADMTKDEIQFKIKDYFLRRKKENVLTELPPILHKDLYLELRGAQLDAYLDVWSSRLELVRKKGMPVPNTNLLAVLTRLKQICNFDPISQESVKLDALKVVLETLAEKTDKIIIFSQYVKTLEWISNQIDEIDYDVYHGKLDQHQRDKIISRFENEPGPRVLLMSLKAGGVGLNLPSASNVILFDRWWNPAVESQAIQRAHRFGRINPLYVIRFLIVNSIEERIEGILKEKRELFIEYIDGMETYPSKISREALKRILDLTSFDVDGEILE